MALELKKTFTNGIEIEKTYSKIVNLNGNKETLDISLAFYLNRECSVDKMPLEIKQYSFIPKVDEDSANFIKQGYEYLKTLEEFKDSIDVLD